MEVEYNGRKISRLEGANQIQYHTIGAESYDNMTDWDVTYILDDHNIVVEYVKTNYYDEPSRKVSSVDYYVDDGTKNGRRIANFNPAIGSLIILKE